MEAFDSNTHKEKGCFSCEKRIYGIIEQRSKCGSRLMVKGSWFGLTGQIISAWKHKTSQCPASQRPLRCYSITDYSFCISDFRFQFAFWKICGYRYRIQFLLNDGRWQMAVLCSVFSIQFCFRVDSWQLTVLFFNFLTDRTLIPMHYYLSNIYYYIYNIYILYNIII